jgi:hypothetical protein
MINPLKHQKIHFSKYISQIVDMGRLAARFGDMPASLQLIIVKCRFWLPRY